MEKIDTNSSSEETAKVYKNLNEHECSVMALTKDN